MSRRPRIRTLKPEFWADEKIGALTRDARCLLVGLVTMADDEGRLRALPPAILGHVFPYDQDAPRKLAGWLDEVIGTGIVLAYENDGIPYLAFRRWRRHQQVNRASASVLPPPPDPSVVAENSVPNSRKDQGGLTDDSVNDHGAVSDRSCSHAQARVPIRSLPTEEQDEPKDQEDDARPRDRAAQVKEVFDAWLAATERDQTRTKLTPERRRRIEKALQSHGFDDCLAAVRHIGADAWARGANDRGRRFDDIDHALGNGERIERWRDQVPRTVAPVTPLSERDQRRHRNSEALARLMGENAA